MPGRFLRVHLLFEGFAFIVSLAGNKRRRICDLLSTGQIIVFTQKGMQRATASQSNQPYM